MTESMPTLTRMDRWCAVGLFWLVMCVGHLRLVPAVVGVFHDDGIYATTAKALAEGHGYRLINLPGEPPQTKYPILYPAMLAAVWLLAPSPSDAFWIMQELTLGTGAALVAMSYLYMVRFGYTTRAPALAACLFCATASQFLYMSTTLLSEAPFGALVIVALWSLECHLREGPRGRWSQALLGLALALPVLCRTAGAPLIPAAIFTLWLHQRPTVTPLLASALVLAPWAAWCTGSVGGWRQDPVVGYYTDYLGWWGEFSESALPQVVRMNAVMLAAGAASQAFDGLLALNKSGPGLPLVVVGMIGFGLIAWLVVGRLVVRRSALGLFLAAYAALILVWPWPPSRFLLPLGPIILALGLDGASKAIGLLHTAIPRAAFTLIAVALMVTNVVALGQVTILTRQTGFPLARTLDTPPVSWSSYRDLFTWLRANTQPGDTLACGLDSMIYLYTDRQAYRPFVHRPLVLFYELPGDGVGPTEELITNLSRRRPRYLVQIPMPGFSEERPFDDVLQDLQARHPTWLREVYRGSDTRFVVYRVCPN